MNVDKFPVKIDKEYNEIDSLLDHYTLPVKKIECYRNEKEKHWNCKLDIKSKDFTGEFYQNYKRLLIDNGMFGIKEGNSKKTTLGIREDNSILLSYNDNDPIGCTKSSFITDIKKNESYNALNCFIPIFTNLE